MPSHPDRVRKNYDRAPYLRTPDAPRFTPGQCDGEVVLPRSYREAPVPAHPHTVAMQHERLTYESARPCGCDPGEHWVAKGCESGCINDPRGVVRAEPISPFILELEKQGIIERVPDLDRGWRRPEEPHNDYSTPPIGDSIHRPGDISLTGGVPQRLDGVFFNCGCRRYHDKHGIETIQRCADGQCVRLGRR